jgi:hypothetical protein
VYKSFYSAEPRLPEEKIPRNTRVFWDAILEFKTHLKPGMVTYVYNPSPQKAEAGRL